MRVFINKESKQPRLKTAILSKICAVMQIKLQVT